MLKEIPIVFYNGSNYDYHFILKESAEGFEKQFTCLEGNTEKYIAFSVLIAKEVTRIDKNEEEVTINISSRLQSIDGARFMASVSSNLVNNLVEVINQIKCKYGHDDNKCETYGVKYKDCACFLKHTNFKVNLIECKCLCCGKNYQKLFDEK